MALQNASAGACARDVLLTSVSDSWPCSSVLVQIKSALLKQISVLFPLPTSGSHLWSTFGVCQLDFFSIEKPEAGTLGEQRSTPQLLLGIQSLRTEQNKSEVKPGFPKYNDEFRSMLPSILLYGSTFTVLQY